MSDMQSTHEIAEATKTGSRQKDPSAPAAEPPVDAATVEETTSDAPRQVLPDGR